MGIVSVRLASHTAEEWEQRATKKDFLMPGKGCETPQTKRMFLRTKNSGKYRWLIPASQGQEENSSWPVPCFSSPSGPSPAHPVSPAQALTGCSDCGAGISVLGAAVGALLVAVVLVGCDTSVASQRLTCVKMERKRRKRSESGRNATSWSPRIQMLLKGSPRGVRQ